MKARIKWIMYCMMWKSLRGGFNPSLLAQKEPASQGRACEETLQSCPVVDQEGKDPCIGG